MYKRQIINWALEMINKRRAKNGEGPLDIAAIPLDDKKSFDMLQRLSLIHI
ncbi:hypothetical protein [Klebsiella aerogenes]|uniref:hypothetical protein n=1 Tax=Klebsiella aerogenes TaxID=548 RepID=UPI001866CA5D|nr:hypothetical protein [Klebsiella aerogenes]